jgi:hypothetical protein
MAENNIQIMHTACGVFCDNEQCNYCDETVELEDMLQWLNKPCPLCGENLLTPEDYNNTIKIQAAVDVINNLTKDEMAKLDRLIKESGIDIENSTVFKDTIGLELLKNPNAQHNFEMLVDSHKQIKVTEIKLVANENEPPNS